MARPTSASLIALALLSLSTAQQGRSPLDRFPQDRPPRDDGTPQADAPEYGKDIFGRNVPLKGDPYGPLQGLWQLVDIDDPELPRSSREHEGYLLVHGKALAFELHVQWSDAHYRGVLFFSRGRWDPADVFQTGIHQFQLDRLGNLRTTALIGSYLDEEDRLAWEDAGATREYQLEVSDNSLTLVRPDGARYDFARHRSAIGSQLDFFGAPGVGERDVFGRKRRAPEEGTDIFGRDPSGATPDIFGRDRPVSGDGDGDEQGGDGTDDRDE